MHFFIDHTKLPVQTSADKYGPVDGHETTQYNVTSKFQLTEEALAFACEDCMMVVQESSENTALVNVILEPISTSSKVSCKVKYYIYRGILKLSLLKEGETKIAEKSTSNNDFIKRIYESRLEVDLYEAGILGYNNSIPPDKNINEIFRSSNINIAPIQVKEGEWFGEFAPATTGTTGFEIILEPEKIDVNFEFVRNGETTINVGGLSGLNLRAKKENVLAFLDPSAFFGLYYQGGINTSTYLGQDKTTVSKKGAELYNDVLSKFLTKDRTYLDIRSDQGYSYNYYQDYQYIGLNNNPTSQEYQTEGWPIIYLENITTLSIKLRTNGNIKPLVYVEQKEIKAKDKNTSFFDDLLDTTNIGWSKSIELSIPFKPYYVKLHYFHSAIDQTSPSPFVRNNRYYDHAFCSIDLIPDDFSSPTSNLREVENSNPVYIGEEYNNNNSEGGFKYIANNGVFWDENKVLFYSNLKVQYRTTGAKFPKAPMSNKLELNNKAYSDQIGKSLDINIRLFENNGETGPHEQNINVLSVAGCNINKLNQRDSVLFLGLTVSEMEAVKTAAISLDPGHNTYLFLDPYTDEPSIYTDSTNVSLPIYLYQLKVQGLDNNGDLAYAVPSIMGLPIIVYSLDRFFYNSKAFSDNKIPNATNQVEFHIYENGVIKSNQPILPIHVKFKVAYFYHKDNQTYHLCNLDLVEIKELADGTRKKNGKEMTGIPSGYSENIGSKYYYRNSNGTLIDIIVDGVYENRRKIFRYSSINKKAYLVRFLFNKSLWSNNSIVQSINVIDNTEREYFKPEIAAAFMGALIEVENLGVRCNGGSYSDGTCWPSSQHASGRALDTDYRIDQNGTIEEDVKIVKALIKFGFKEIRTGTADKFAKIREIDKKIIVFDESHNNHLHSTNLIRNES